MKNLLLLIVVSVLLTACGGVPQEKIAVMPPVTAQQTYVEPEQAYANPGSIYSLDASDGLFADTRARRVGDIVMVKIIENHSAINKADITTTKDTSNQYGVDAFFGKSDIDLFSGLGGASIPVGGIALGTSSVSETTNEGETTRGNSVTSTIAARVLRVLPNGILQIEGVRETKINFETQYLVVTGLVRAIDVAPDNSITSNRIADAHIAYYGKGVVSDKQKPGWFTRFMDNVWPF